MAFICFVYCLILAVVFQGFSFILVGCFLNSSSVVCVVCCWVIVLLIFLVFVWYHHSCLSGKPRLLH